jgi:hypothetical protein
MHIFNIAQVKKLTAEQRDVASGLVEKPALTAEQQLILDAVNNGSWGCQDSSVRALVTAITGINCDKPDRNSPYKVGTMVVFTSNDHHETLLVRYVGRSGDGRVFGKEGNETFLEGSYSYMGTDWMTSDGAECKVRWATDAEIDAFFGIA